MEKAWDKQALIEELKVNGLDVAEELAKVLVEGVLSWVEKSVVLSKNKYKDFAIPVISALKPFVLKEIDKIDQKEG